mmetsp:Transcript_10589/g.65174  ORF Transcript_10589/g.65174 Transcript_10589/m.65174 type:complete len:355 (+) Transcript_10589:5597-6661(+)
MRRTTSVPTHGCPSVPRHPPRARRDPTRDAREGKEGRNDGGVDEWVVERGKNGTTTTRVGADGRGSDGAGTGAAAAAGPSGASVRDESRGMVGVETTRCQVAVCTRRTDLRRGVRTMDTTAMPMERRRRRAGRGLAKSTGDAEESQGRTRAAAFPSKPRRRTGPLVRKTRPVHALLAVGKLVLSTRRSTAKRAQEVLRNQLRRSCVGRPRRAVQLAVPWTRKTHLHQPDLRVSHGSAASETRGRLGKSRRRTGGTRMELERCQRRHRSEENGRQRTRQSDRMLPQEIQPADGMETRRTRVPGLGRGRFGVLLLDQWIPSGILPRQPAARRVRCHRARQDRRKRPRRPSHAMERR